MIAKVLQQLQRKSQREEKEILESILHPYPTISDIEILHIHVGQYIKFEAWRRNYPLFPMAGRRFIRVHKNDVLYRTPYLSERDIAWLVGVLS